MFTKCLHIAYNKLKQTMALIKPKQKVIAFRPTKEQKKLINETAKTAKIKTIPEFFDKAVTTLSIHKELFKQS